MRVDLIIFDCDGVIADSEVLSAQVLIDQLARLDIVVTPDDVQRALHPVLCHRLVVAPEVDDLVAGLGRHLVDFGRERVQLLAVARVDEHMAAAVAEQTPGNVRILADHDGALAERYGVTYRPGAPTTVLIDEDGQVAQRWVDRAGPALAEDLVARLGQLSVL